MHRNAHLLAHVTSILETPILDPHKWSKLPSLDVDAVLLDMEDSVPPQRKEDARDRVAACIAEPTDLGGRLGLPRMNPLDTPWGPRDLEAVARSGAPLVVYPKLRSEEELCVLESMLDRHGSKAGIVVIIETARAVIELENIAAHERVAGFLFGPSDLAEDVGWDLFDKGGVFKDPYYYPRSKLVLTAAAFEVPVYDTVFVPKLKDAAQVSAAVASAKAMGFTGMTTFYPPHLEAIREQFTPGAEIIEAARSIVRNYEAAMREGRAAVQVDGRALIVQDYKRARALLDRAGAPTVSR